MFWWNGNYYLTINTINVAGGNTATIIAAEILAGNLQLVQEFQLPGSYSIFGSTVTYISTIQFVFWGSLLTCLLDKLNKYNCGVKNNIQGRLVCESDDLDLILQLNFIFQFQLVNLLDPTDPKQLLTINSFANYINQNCNCKNCKC